MQRIRNHGRHACREGGNDFNRSSIDSLLSVITFHRLQGCQNRICKAVEYYRYTHTSRGILPSYISSLALECAATVLNQYTAVCRGQTSQSFVRRVTTARHIDEEFSLDVWTDGGEDARRVLSSHLRVTVIDHARDFSRSLSRSSNPIFLVRLENNKCREQAASVM